MVPSLITELLGLELPAWLAGLALVLALSFAGVEHVKLLEAQTSEANAKKDLAEAKARAAQMVEQQIKAAMEHEHAMQADKDRAVKALQDYRSRAAAERSATERRLRDQANAYASASGSDVCTDPGAACRSDAPPGARLSDTTRGDLVSLAADANDIAVTLGQCQALLSSYQKANSK